MLSSEGRRRRGAEVDVFMTLRCGRVAKGRRAAAQCFGAYFVIPRSTFSAVYRLPATSVTTPSPAAPLPSSVLWPGTNAVTLPSFALPIQTPFVQPAVFVIGLESASIA